MQQIYSCPTCGLYVTWGTRYCEYCGTPFNWAYQQQGWPQYYNGQPYAYQQSEWDYQQIPSFQPEWDYQQRLSYQPQWDYRQMPTYQPQGSYQQVPLYPPQWSYQQQKYEYRGTTPTQPAKKFLLTGLISILVVGLLSLGISFLLNTSAYNTSSSVSVAPQIPYDMSSPVSIIPQLVEEQKINPVIRSDFVQQHINEQLPYLKSTGERINLTNNPNAKNVSYTELKSFILKDATDDETYIPGIKMCADFAEKLHNSAEAKNISAAFVAIHFEDNLIGHAINAFQTTDKGLVYIDCTGQEIKQKSYSHDSDNIAYIEKGEEYGVISIDKVESFDYDFYVLYAQKWLEFKSMLNDFKNEIASFNQKYGNRTLSEPEFSTAKAWQKKIEEKRRLLTEMTKKLGDYFIEPLGIVKTVDIYW